MYYPKSRIVEGLYTNGGEFMYKINNELYVGYYHKFYNGKTFSGKTQKASPKQEIIPVIGNLNSNVDKLYILNTDTKVALFLGDPDPIVDISKWNQSEIIKYLKLKGLPTNEDNPRKVPQIHYPQPTDKDYENRTIKRYFAMKTNERDIFIEISKDVYKKLKDQDKKWMWERYQIFTIIWTIVGETESQVEETNRNILYLKQREIRRSGLIAYLRGNCSKFFKSISQLKLEASPPQSNLRKKTPPNAKPIPPTPSEIKSKKFFKEKNELEIAEILALNRELEIKEGQEQTNKPLFGNPDVTKNIDEIPEIPFEPNTSILPSQTPTPPSTTTGGY